MTLRSVPTIISPPPGTPVRNYLKVCCDAGDVLILFDDRDADDVKRAHDEAWAVVDAASPGRARICIWYPCMRLAALPVIGEATLAAEDRPSGTWWNVSRKGAA